MRLLMSRRTRTAACTIARGALEGISIASFINRLSAPSVGLGLGLARTGSRDVDPLGLPQVRRGVKILELASFCSSPTSALKIRIDLPSERAASGSFLAPKSTIITMASTAQCPGPKLANIITSRHNLSLMGTAVGYNAIPKLPSGRLLGSYRVFPVLGVVRIWAVGGRSPRSTSTSLKPRQREGQQYGSPVGPQVPKTLSGIHVEFTIGIVVIHWRPHSFENSGLPRTNTENRLFRRPDSVGWARPARL